MKWILIILTLTVEPGNDPETGLISEYAFKNMPSLVVCQQHGDMIQTRSTGDVMGYLCLKMEVNSFDNIDLSRPVWRR